MYPRTVKIRSSNGTLNEYVRIVEAYREEGKVKQRVVADLGRKDVLLAMLPKLQRWLRGEIEPADSAASELGWHPATPLAEGIDRVYRWIEAGAADRAAC